MVGRLPWEQEIAGSNPAAVTNAPIAQSAERTAYTRHELRTGARLEVRILLGVPNFSEGGAWWHATGLENRADLMGRGFDSFTFRQFDAGKGTGRPAVS